MSITMLRQFQSLILIIQFSFKKELPNILVRSGSWLTTILASQSSQIPGI